MWQKEFRKSGVYLLVNGSSFERTVKPDPTKIKKIIKVISNNLFFFWGENSSNTTDNYTEI